MLSSIINKSIRNIKLSQRYVSIKIQKSKVPGSLPPMSNLGFGKYFTDHMVEFDWSKEKGWGDIHIKPFQNLSVHPAISGLHYGIQCFEGLKAYKDMSGNIRLFRPMSNMDRMTISMTRLCLPEFPKEQFLEAIKQCIVIDKRFIPSERGTALYVRPTAIGSAEELGVHESTRCKMFCIFSPVGSYYPTGMKPITLFATNDYARSCPGGIGYTKAGGNYAPTIYPGYLANKKGFSQILWLYNDYVTEGGAMNVMFLINHGSKKELWTAPLDGLILPGITRDSVIKLVQSWGDIKVCEKKFTIHDLMELSKEKKIEEAFCTGTAAVLTPIKSVTYDNVEYVVNSGDKIGNLTSKLYDNLLNIQYGSAENPFKNDPWSIVI